MSSLSWAATVRLVHERASYTCEYCQTTQRVIGQAMHVEHIEPRGGDLPENLCLACSSCNFSKGILTSTIDPRTSLIVALYNPRTQKWDEHFAWSEDGLTIIGLTPTGRATVARLKMNQPRIIEARTIWVRAGVHPPTLKSR